METDVSAFLLSIWFMYIFKYKVEKQKGKKKCLKRTKSVDLWMKYCYHWNYSYYDTSQLFQNSKNVSCYNLDILHQWNVLYLLYIACSQK